MTLRLLGTAGVVITTVGDDLDGWPIVVTNRDDKWWHFDGGVLDFLVGICDGSLRCSKLPDDFPELPAIKELKGYEKRRFPGFEQELDTPVMVPTSRWRSYFEQRQ